jgi:hypothetical protein
MNEADKGKIIAGLVSFAVYVVAAWLIAKIFDASIWRSFGVLVAARLFFGVIEGAAGILNWRLFGRRVTVSRFLEILRSNNCPSRFYQHDDFLNYLARIDGDTNLPESARRAAKVLHEMLGLFEAQGILIGARMHAASELALEAYSPKANAPVM